MKRLLHHALWIVPTALILYQAWLFAHVWWWVDHNPQRSALMDERLDQLQAQHPDARLQHEWVPYGQISANLKRAVVAAEDARFLEHHGFDWNGIQFAAEKDLRRGHIVAGGSTISQQLAKNLLLSDQRTPWRKIEEAIITIMIEHMMSKRRILEIYLNDIEWGNGIFGAQAAASHYFHTSAARLSPSEAARLAAMVPNPRYYDTHRNSRELQRRTVTIGARMNQAIITR